MHTWAIPPPVLQPQALAKYSDAIAADGTDMSFYTNRAAVYTASLCKGAVCIDLCAASSAPVCGRSLCLYHFLMITLNRV